MLLFQKNLIYNNLIPEKFELLLLQRGLIYYAFIPANPDLLQKSMIYNALIQCIYEKGLAFKSARLAVHL